MQRSCFADQTYCLFDVPVALAVVAKADVVGDNKRQLNEENEEKATTRKEKKLFCISPHTRKARKLLNFLLGVTRNANSLPAIIHSVILNNTRQNISTRQFPPLNYFSLAFLLYNRKDQKTTTIFPSQQPCLLTPYL